MGRPCPAWSAPFHYRDADKGHCCAHQGRLDEARAELARVLAMDPRFTFARYRGLLAAATAPEMLELLVQGMRLAGLPED